MGRRGWSSWLLFASLTSMLGPSACAADAESDHDASVDREVDQEPEAGSGGDGDLVRFEERFVALGVGDGPIVQSAVDGADRWTTTYEELPSPTRCTERVRLPDQTFVRTAADCSAVRDRPYRAGSVEELTELGRLTMLGLDGATDATTSAVELIFPAVTELAVTSPGVLVGDEVQPATSVEAVLPDEIVEAVARLGLEIPETRVRVTSGDNGVAETLDVTVVDGVESLSLEVNFRPIEGEFGEGILAESLSVRSSEVDLTPLVDEEAVAALNGIALLSPPLPSTERIPVGATVISAEASFEGCERVQLDFALIGDPQAEPVLTYLLARRACMVRFDDTPFDEVLGGHPARFDRDQILIGDTVVHFALTEVDGGAEAVASGLTPTTGDALLEAMGE